MGRQCAALVLTARKSARQDLYLSDISTQINRGEHGGNAVRMLDDRAFGDQPSRRHALIAFFPGGGGEGCDFEIAETNSGRRSPGARPLPIGALDLVTHETSCRLDLSHALPNF